MIMKPTKISVHTELGNNGFLGVNAYHRGKWPHFKSSLGYHIGYQWYWDKITGWHQGRREDEEGAHTVGHNTDAIGVCLQGDHRYEKPNSEMKAILFAKLDDIRQRWNIDRKDVYGHGELQE